MKCCVCGERKGKRPCPAKDAAICPQCCGEKRILEIDCPEHCEYLQAGRKCDAERSYAPRLRALDPAKMQVYQRVLKEFGAVVSALEYIVADTRRSSRSLTDKDVAEAAELVIKTLRTEESGLIYEHTSTSLEVEIVRRRFIDALRKLRHPEHAGQRALRPEEALPCFELIREMARGQSNTPASSQRYVDLLARMLPSRSRIDSGPSSIIIPGR